MLVVDFDTPADGERKRRKHGSKRAERLWAMYALTELDYEDKLNDQGGGCWVCGGSGSRRGLVPTERLDVDHDHRCCPGAGSCGACVRGLLCGACNAALGYLDEDIQRALKLVAYMIYWGAFEPLERGSTFVDDLDDADWQPDEVDPLVNFQALYGEAA